MEHCEEFLLHGFLFRIPSNIGNIPAAEAGLPFGSAFKGNEVNVPFPSFNR